MTSGTALTPFKILKVKNLNIHRRISHLQFLITHQNRSKSDTKIVFMVEGKHSFLKLISLTRVQTLFVKTFYHQTNLGNKLTI